MKLVQYHNVEKRVGAVTNHGCFALPEDVTMESLPERSGTELETLAESGNCGAGSHSLRQTDAFQLPYSRGGGVLWDSTMQTLRSGTVSVRSMRYMECPQSSSGGKDAGTKPIPKFAFTMGSI